MATLNDSEVQKLLSEPNHAVVSTLNSDGTVLNTVAWIDVEKPFWWDVPVWVAARQVDSIGLANNHMCRDKMSETEAWGKPRVVEGLPAEEQQGIREVLGHVWYSVLLAWVNGRFRIDEVYIDLEMACHLLLDPREFA